MFVTDRKNSQSTGRSKKKVPKELLAALKNTQKLPPPPYGRFPEAGYPPMPLDPHLHEMQRRAAMSRPEVRPEEKGKAPQIKVIAPPHDDILEDDIDKIAFEKKSRPQKDNNKPEAQKSAEEPKKSELPHIQEKEIQTTQNHLVQSVYYPEGTKPPAKQASRKPQKQGPSKEDLLVDRLYHTDRKAAGGYHRDPYREQYHDAYHREYRSRSRSPEFFDPRQAEYEEVYNKGYPPLSKEELYREYAQRHRTNTVPSLRPGEERQYHQQPPKANTKAPKALEQQNFNDDLLYPETTKADRVVVNRGYEERPRKELNNITNKSAYPSFGSAAKVPPGYGGYYPNDRLYEGYGKPPTSLYPADRRYRDAPLYRDLYETARKPQFGYSSSYLDLGLRDPYRTYGRFF